MKTNRDLIMSVLSVGEGLTSSEVRMRTGLAEKKVSTALSALVLRQKTVGRSKTPGFASEYFLLKPHVLDNQVNNIEAKLKVLRNIREVLPEDEQEIVGQIIHDYETFKGNAK